MTAMADEWPWKSVQENRMRKIKGKRKDYGEISEGRSMAGFKCRHLEFRSSQFEGQERRRGDCRGKKLSGGRR